MIAIAILLVAAGIAFAQDDPRRLDRDGQEAAARAQEAEAPDAEAQDAEVDEAVADEGAAPQGAEPGAEEGLVSFDAFAEPVQITELVNLIASILEINISVDPNLSGEVVFNESVTVAEEDLLDLLDAMLERQGFTLTLDEKSGFYIIEQTGEVPANLEGELATVKIIDTPNVRPSNLQEAIQTAVGQGALNLAFLDELGVILARGPARQINLAERIVTELLEKNAARKRYEIPLDNIAASVARDRALALSGGAEGGVGGATGNVAQRRRDQQQRQQAGGDADVLSAAAAVNLNNLAERLAVSPSGNALLFVGTDEEYQNVLQLVELIDAEDTLEPKTFFAGAAVREVAGIASQRGLGEVVEFDRGAGTGQGRTGLQQRQQQLAGQDAGFGAGVGGPSMIVYAEKGQITYYGTDQQHQIMARLIEELDTESERIVLRTYKLSNSSAEDVATILEALITGESPAGDSPLLPGQQGQGTDGAQQPPPGIARGFGDDEIGAFDPSEVFVTPDESNNQIVVRAPIGVQEDLEKLIRKLDLRRQQVYIEALIVSVSDSTDFTLAIESQIPAGEFQAQTNFGLTGSGDTFQAARTVNTGLGGFTAAIIQSSYVPFVINAIQTDTDSRVLSTPQILVNDNEEAEIVSLVEEPTTQTQVGETSDITSFQGFQEAGTTLTVTPTISEAGYLRLEYNVELSSFQGSGSGGIPPPRTNDTVSGLATIPSDSTIVVGGITVDRRDTTIAKIPLLGDIPLVGQLFRDTSINEEETTLYVFITPRIMSDPNFNDLRALTRGPQADVELDPSLPDMKPEAIEFLPPRSLSLGPASPDLLEGMTEPPTEPADIEDERWRERQRPDPPAETLEQAPPER